MKYRLWVARGGGVPTAIVLDAPSGEAARMQAQASGFDVIDAPEVARHAWMVLATRSKKFEIDLFSQELVALLRAGLNLVEGLRALAEKSTGHEKVVMASLLQALTTGKRFSDALAEEGGFPELYVSLIRASERTSDLPTALERYLAYSTQMDAVRQRLVSAAIYPIVLLIVGSGAFLFLLFFVVPRFAGIYEGMHGSLPWAAVLMMNWGKAVHQYGTEISLVVAVAVAATVAAISSPDLRQVAMRRFLELPAIGPRTRLFYMARLYRTIGMLLAGGIPVTQALLMSLELLPSGLRLHGESALKAMNEGRSPAAAFREAQLSTSISEQMLVVGERSGDLGAMMTRIADFYEREIARTLDRVMRVFEPVLMTAIGIAIGLVIVLMYLPIFELASAIQ